MIQKSDIETKIKAALSGFLKIEPSKMKGNSLLREKLGLDSMDTIELAFELEDNFNIKISDDDLMGFKTMDDVVEYVAIKANENK